MLRKYCTFLYFSPILLSKTVVTILERNKDTPRIIKLENRDIPEKRDIDTGKRICSMTKLNLQIARNDDFVEIMKSFFVKCTATGKKVLQNSSLII